MPGGIRLAKLHDILQVAVGWTNSHLHNFTINDQLYGMNFDDYPEGEIDEKTVTVISALKQTSGFTYEYDFGDGWEHDVVIEATFRTSAGLKSAVCLAGENACPPEDSGGPWGYASMLEVLSDPAHEDYEHFSSWIGGQFDPAAFDITQANAQLQRI